MEVLIIGSFDIYLHPYVEKYISILEKNNIDYRFIYWNREGANDFNKNNIPFNYSINGCNKIKKIYGYFKFYFYVKKMIKSYSPKFLIFLASQSMFLFSFLAIRKYKKRYIFDYRDETFEKYRIFYKIMKKCIKNSSVTIVSSLGFKENVLEENGENKVLLCHNIKSSYYPSTEKIKEEVIKVSFWGLIRQPEYYKKIIKIFANDSRFMINFYGVGDSNVLIDIIKKNHFTNVKVHGKYLQSDIPKFVANTDILLNCYSNQSIQKNAITVKMYEGIYYDIPMIIQKNSYMEEYLLNNNYKFFSFDFDKDYNNAEEIKANIISNYLKFDNKVSRIEMLKKIYDENNMFLTEITKILIKVGEYK